ncbi:MAG TPA: hypothetical protein VGH98_08565 [Gemmatimonadaceae bacterium]
MHRSHIRRRLSAHLCLQQNGSPLDLTIPVGLAFGHPNSYSLAVYAAVCQLGVGRERYTTTIAKTSMITLGILLDDRLLRRRGIGHRTPGSELIRPRLGPAARQLGHWHEAAAFAICRLERQPTLPHHRPELRSTISEPSSVAPP